MTHREQHHRLAQALAEFQRWQNLAIQRGWKLPGNSPLPNESWIRYWQACDRYERGETQGRSVVPHRSAGA